MKIIILSTESHLPAEFDTKSRLNYYERALCEVLYDGSDVLCHVLSENWLIHQHQYFFLTSLLPVSKYRTNVTNPRGCVDCSELVEVRGSLNARERQAWQVVQKNHRKLSVWTASSEQKRIQVWRLTDSFCRMNPLGISFWFHCSCFRTRFSCDGRKSFAWSPVMTLLLDHLAVLYSLHLTTLSTEVPSLYPQDGTVCVRVRVFLKSKHSHGCSQTLRF